MTAVSRGLSRPQPIVTTTLFSTRRKYQLVRMKEMLSNALTGNRSGNLFGVPRDVGGATYPGSAVTEGFAMPAAVMPSSAALGQALKPVARKGSVEVT